MTIIIPGRPQRPVTVQPGRDLPPGGTAGQALIKSSDSDFATTWGTATSSAAWGAITGTLASQTDLQSALDAKQVALVSGANIKTVNGSNILGAGDLVVSSSIADGDKGDIAVSGSGATWTIDAGVVSLAKMADLATSTILGRATAGTGVPEALTGTQATALLDVFTSAAKGLAPASGGGTANYLRADGTWAAPPGGGGGITDGDKGDVTVSGSGATWTIDNGVVTNAKMADMLTTRIKGRETAGTGSPEDLTGAQVTNMLDVFGASGGGHKKGLVPDPPGTSGTAKFLREDATWAAVTESIIVAASDETTALTTGSAKVTFRMPYAFTLTAVRASLTTAQASGSIFTVDINEEGTTVLSTKLTIDNTEKTSTTASAAAVISDTALADDAEITIDIDQIGDGTAKGLKVYLIGYQS